MEQTIVKWFIARNPETEIEVVKTNCYQIFCSELEGLDEGDLEQMTLEVVDEGDNVINITGKSVHPDEQLLQADLVYKTILSVEGDSYRVYPIETDKPVALELHFVSPDGDFGFGVF